MILGWRNKLDDAGLTAAGLEGTLPIQNAQVNPVALPARRVGTVMTVDFDYGSQTAWEAFAILAAHQGGDLSAAATVRIMLSNASAGGVDVHDTGTVSAGATEGYPQVYVVLSAEQTARYGRIVITDTSLAFMDVGRLAGYGGAGFWQPTFGHSLGRPASWADRSIKRKSLGGQILTRKVPRGRVIEFALEENSVDEMFDQAFELDREAGITGDVLIMLEESGRRQELTVWGPIVRVTPLRRNRLLTEAKLYTIEERL